MRGRRLLLIGGVGALLIAGIAFALVSNARFRKWYRPPVAVLPAADDVAEMRASLRASSIGVRWTPEFVVPAEHVPVILRWLGPAHYVPVSLLPCRPNDELGEIQIKGKDGQQVRLRFFWAGRNPVVFTLDGIDYFWGNDFDDQGRWVGDGGALLAKAVETAAQRANP